MGLDPWITCLKFYHWATRSVKLAVVWQMNKCKCVNVIFVWKIWNTKTFKEYFFNCLVLFPNLHRQTTEFVMFCWTFFWVLSDLWFSSWKMLLKPDLKTQVQRARKLPLHHCTISGIYFIGRFEESYRHNLNFLQLKESIHHWVWGTLSFVKGGIYLIWLKFFKYCGLDPRDSGTKDNFLSPEPHRL